MASQSVLYNLHSVEKPTRSSCFSRYPQGVFGSGVRVLQMGQFAKNRPEGPFFTLNNFNYTLAAFRDGSAFGLGLINGQPMSFDTRPAIKTDVAPEVASLCNLACKSGERALEIWREIRDRWPGELDRAFSESLILGPLRMCFLASLMFCLSGFTSRDTQQCSCVEELNACLAKGVKTIGKGAFEYSASANSSPGRRARWSADSNWHTRE